MRHLADHAVRAVWGCLTMTYFHGRESPLSSALSRFTVLFGMGRGGANSLWSSGMACCRRAAQHTAAAGRPIRKSIKKYSV